VWFYLSFCDVDKPKGSQFLGAAVVFGDSPEDAVISAAFHGVNPGGECAIMELEGFNPATCSAKAVKYVNQFVPREEVMTEIGYMDVSPDAFVCQKHNPAKALQP
jgi:hypothetical protein